MGPFDLRFMWRPTTSEQSAQFAGALAKNAWIPAVVINPPVGAALLTATVSSACTSPTTNNDAYVPPDNKPQVDIGDDADTWSHPLIDMLGDVVTHDSSECHYDCEERDLLTDVPDGDVKAQDSETTDELNEGKLTDLDGTSQPDEIFQPDTPDLDTIQPDVTDTLQDLDGVSYPDEVAQPDLSDEVSQPEVDQLDALEDEIGLDDQISDVGVDTADNLDLLDTADETVTPPPECLIGNASETFLVVKGFADPEKLQPLSFTEFLADLAPATVPAPPIYISIVVYNVGDEILPADEEGLKLCYHGFGVSTCEDNASFELTCDDSLAYGYGPISSIGLYGWTSVVNLAAFEVRASTSSYGLTIYADPSSPDSSCYSLFNTYSCEYL